MSYLLLPKSNGLIGEINSQSSVVALMQAALDALPAHIAILDDTGKIIGVNARWIDYAKENALARFEFGVGDNYLDICRPASVQNDPDAVAVINGLSCLLSGSLHEPFNHEYLCAHPADPARDRWFHLSVMPFSLNGKRCALVSHADITARHVAERSRKLLEAAMANTRSAIMITNRSGDIEYVNAGFSEITGYAEHEVLGKNPRFLKSGKIPAETYADIWQSISSGLPWKGQVCNRRKDGQLYWEEMTINPMKDPDGVITHFVAVKEDITDERLKESLYAGVISASADGFIALDEQLRITEWSPQAETILGLVTSEVIGKDFIASVIAPDLLADALFQFRLFQSGEPSRLIGRPHRTQMRHRDGSILPIELWLTAIELQGDRRFSGFIRDLSDVVRGEHVLLEAQKMEGIGQMAGGLAHDFNNLLHIIGGSLHIAALKAPPEIIKHLNNAIDAAKRGAEITKSLTTFARRGEMHPVEADINELLIGIEPLIQQTVGKKIDVTLTATAIQSKVQIDVSGFNNAIINLAANARDAMPAGGKLLIYAYSQHIAHKVAGAPIDLPEGDYVVVGVDDTGEGMPEAVIAKAFEPFFTTKELGNGTGLGLAMVYGLCRQSGGSARISSQLGVGTSMQLILPTASPKTKVKS